MIALIKGIVSAKNGNSIVLLTNGGVGYTITSTPQLLSHPIGAEITVSTYCHIKEDGWILFGFDSDAQKKLFTQLITIDGVGPKTAFVILTTKTITELSQALISKDVKTFESVSGVGKKTAARIILELSSKLGEDVDIKALLDSGRVLDKTIVDTLTTLGFTKKAVIEVLNDLDDQLSFDETIKQALKKLSSQ